MPKVFSAPTLEKFEDAAASIPLRQLVRAFENAGVRASDDPGGSEGARRTQFRRYVAGTDQRVSRQVERLGAALGALIAEVATSKIEFLVKAAESDGFVFADGAFTATQSKATSFTVTELRDVASIDERARLLGLLATENPKAALEGARELIASLCRTVLRFLDVPLPKKAAGLAEIGTTTLEALERASPGCRRFLDAVVTLLAERHQARLAVGAAAAFAHFVAETYVEASTSW